MLIESLVGQTIHEWVGLSESDSGKLFDRFHLVVSIYGPFNGHDTLLRTLNWDGKCDTILLSDREAELLVVRGLCSEFFYDERRSERIFRELLVHPNSGT